MTSPSLPEDRAETLGQSLDQAAPRRRRSPPPPRDDGEPPAKRPIQPQFAVPEGCPVTPLGVDGKSFVFIDAVRQLITLSHRDFGSHGLSALFGDDQGQLWLDQAWPRFNAKGDPMGLDKDRAARSLMAACAKRGVFNTDNKVRGVGAWSDSKGNLLWHLGDTVLVVKPDGRQHFAKPGLIGDHVYPLGDPQPRPAVTEEMSEQRAATKLYDLLQTWAWKRGALDARLKLGFTGCALIAGALNWRPAVWETGGQGTGKTTMQNEVMQPVLGGPDAVIQTSDATGAGIHQAISHRSIPVLFDELEPNPRSRGKVEKVVELARAGASGARIVRGSADGGAAREFVARVCFAFASILIPRLEPQDAMRICVLELGDLGDRKEPKIDSDEMNELGRALRHRLVTRWQHWPERLAAWRDHVRAAGFSSRVAQTWATLLAMADHLLAEDPAIGEPSSDYFAEWIDVLKPSLDALIAAQGSDWARLLHYLLTLSPDTYQRGQRWPLSTLISVASGRGSAHDPDVGDLSDVKACALLEGYGVKLMWSAPPKRHRDDPDNKMVQCIALVGNHSEFNKLLRDEKWGGDGYTQTLLRMPGAWSAQQRVARNKVQCTMIPLDLLVPRDEMAAKQLPFEGDADDTAAPAI